MYFTPEQIREAIKSRDPKLLSATLDGSDYNQGYMEDMEQTIENLSLTVAKLVIYLLDRGSLSEVDATKVFYAYPDIVEDGEDET